MKKILNSKGLSLVEIIVSIALLAAVLTILATTFMTAFNILLDASKRTKHSNDTAAGIELKTASASSSVSGVTVSQASSTFTITFGASNITVSGDLLQGSTASSKVTYKSFTPN